MVLNTKRRYLSNQASGSSPSLHELRVGSIQAYELGTVPVWRKYAGLFDAVLAVLLDLVGYGEKGDDTDGGQESGFYSLKRSADADAAPAAQEDTGDTSRLRRRNNRNNRQSTPDDDKDSDTASQPASSHTHTPHHRHQLLRIIAPPTEYMNGIRAMLHHRTQLVWFRWFYLAFSRYMAINELRRL